jgi:diadenosine tetraphosphate (Ap4A) HIT family hydrolase
LKSTPLAESAGAFLLDAYGSPGCYLIIPIEHAETPGELPDTWVEDMDTLLPEVPADLSNYNLSFNMGKEAGQTVEHMHMWVIPRAAGEPASGKGLAALINQANQE